MGFRGILNGSGILNVVEFQMEVEFQKPNATQFLHVEVVRLAVYCFFRIVVMPPPVDLALYIPVICTQEDAPKYNGKCFMEAISKVQKVNGESIPSDRRLVKADFKTGDLVVIKFMNRQYSGVVDFSLDEETVSKRVDSPPQAGFAGSPPSSDGLEVQPPAEPLSSAPAPAPASLQKETFAESAVVVTAAGGSVATADTKRRTRKRIRVEDYPLPTLAVPKPKIRRNAAAGGAPKRKRRASGKYFWRLVWI